MEFIPPREHPDSEIPLSVVYLDGQDISAICFRAVEYDDGTLEASVYVRTQAGDYLLTDDKKDVQTTVLRGKGSIVPR